MFSFFTSWNKCLIFSKALPCILTPPCQNGGACANNNIGGYICICVNGYTGVNCQHSMFFKLSITGGSNKIILLFSINTKALPCILSNPCLYGSTCTNNNLSGYTCSCLTGYTGTNCQYRTFIFLYFLFGCFKKEIIFFLLLKSTSMHSNRSMSKWRNMYE